MIVLISGGSCSGKSTLAKKFDNSCIVPMDHFYKGKSEMKAPYNFDEPTAVDLEELYQSVSLLKNKKKATIPQYSILHSERTGEQQIKPANLIVVEGIFVLLHKKLREIADLKIFLDVPEETRLRRRIARDISRGRDEQQTIKHSKLVDKMHEIHVEPQKQFADLVL